jgi:hypothetical protein
MHTPTDTERIHWQVWVQVWHGMEEHMLLHVRPMVCNAVAAAVWNGMADLDAVTLLEHALRQHMHARPVDGLTFYPEPR